MNQKNSIKILERREEKQRWWNNVEWRANYNWYDMNSENEIKRIEDEKASKRI